MSTAGLEIAEVSILPTGHTTNAEVCRTFFDALDVPTAAIPQIKRDYLDWLRHADLPFAVSKGRDALGRRFVALRITCGYDDDEPEEHVAVAHERYTSRSDLWVMAGAGGYIDATLGHPCPNVAGIQRLIREGEITTEEHGMICKIRLV